jgi:hypothetical protein
VPVVTARSPDSAAFRTVTLMSDTGTRLLGERGLPVVRDGQRNGSIVSVARGATPSGFDARHANVKIVAM